MVAASESHQTCSERRGVLRNFVKFTGKHLCQSLFFNKVAGMGDYVRMKYENSILT